MFDAHRQNVSMDPASTNACATSIPDPRPTAGRAPPTPGAARVLLRDFARSEREFLAVECLRLVLAAYEDADISTYAHAHDLAEGAFERRRAVDYVRLVSSIARALRRQRAAGFCYLRCARGVVTPDEGNFLHALQAAIDGNRVGLDAASLVLTQSSCGRAVADDMWRLAKLTLAADWSRRTAI